VVNGFEGRASSPAAAAPRHKKTRKAPFKAPRANVADDGFWHTTRRTGYH
jgi:hypothetical protein